MKTIITKHALRLVLTSIFLLTNISLYAKPVVYPDWFDEEGLEELYPLDTYIRERGEGRTKEAAENSAVSYISRYFETHVDYSSLTEMSAIQTEDSTDITEKAEISTLITSNMKLFGVKYTEAFYLKKSKTYYVVAYIDRKEAWEQYRPSLQNSRDKLFSFYDVAEKNEEPLYKMFIYMQSTEHEEEFFSAYSFARILSTTLTDTNYGSDLKIVSSVSAKVMEEKNKCTFSINISGDEKNIVYQCVKDELSGAGYTVCNAGEPSLYTVSVIVHLDDTPMNSLHVIRASVELTIKGKTASFFSYAKQSANVSGINEDIVKQKAAKIISDEIHNSFINEFNEKLDKGIHENISL